MKTENYEVAKGIHSGYGDFLQELSELRKSKEDLETRASSLETRLTGLAGADKKHDLLDMELETAERRISELSTQVRELREAAAKEAEATERERGLRANLEAVVRELETTLEREQERAEDFKVCAMYLHFEYPDLIH